MKKKTVGITGQSGFIGSFLTNFVRFVDPAGLEVIDFRESSFRSAQKLQDFVSKCDTIVHLAGMSRGDESEIYKTNIDLTNRLIDALGKTGSRSQVIFASSIHESGQSPFGRSKKESRLLLERWAKKNRAQFSGLVIPHVFGPFAKPFHNSAVATFCYQLATGRRVKLINNSELKLIYIEHLILKIIEIIRKGKSERRIEIAPDVRIKVSDILEKLKSFSALYTKQGIIPDLRCEFDINLFNTLRSYIGENERKVFLEKHKDSRGYFCEMAKAKSEGQFSFSSTGSGVERGNHFHTSKIERICVIEGKAQIKIRKIGEKGTYSFLADGNRPVAIDMPIWFTHSIKNVSPKPLITTFFTNEIFDPAHPDTYHEKV